MHIRVGKVRIEGSEEDIRNILKYDASEYYFSSARNEFFKISEMDNNHLMYATLDLLENEIKIYRSMGFGETFKCLTSGVGTGNVTLLELVMEGRRRCQS